MHICVHLCVSKAGGGVCVPVSVYLWVRMCVQAFVRVRGETWVGGKEGGVACSNGSLKEINGLQMAQSIYSNETCKVAGQTSEIRLGLAERHTAKETRVSLSLTLHHARNTGADLTCPLPHSNRFEQPLMFSVLNEFGVVVWELGCYEDTFTCG